jgi:anti-anti-sigma factor
VANPASRLLCRVERRGFSNRRSILQVWLTLVASTGPDDSAVVVLTMCGELDSATVPVAQASIDELVSGGRRMVIDVASVTFIDAAAIGLFVHLNNAMLAEGGFLALQNPSKAVQRVLKLADADGLAIVVTGEQTAGPPATETAGAV